MGTVNKDFEALIDRLEPCRRARGLWWIKEPLSIEDAKTIVSAGYAYKLEERAAIIHGARNFAGYTLTLKEAITFKLAAK